MPLLRTEGNIDSYGFGKEILSALPKEVFQREQAKLDSLMQPISELKSSGRWNAAEYEGVVLHILDALDNLLLPAALIGRLMEYQELGRVRLRGRRTAVLCRSTHGIYEVEEHLKERYGKLLGLVVLDQGAGKYTIRRSDGYAIPPLRKLYNALNRADANASSRRNGENRWGGADDIGGSPRETGSVLSGHDILHQIDRLFGERLPLWRRFVRFMTKPRRIPGIGSSTGLTEPGLADGQRSDE